MRQESASTVDVIAVGTGQALKLGEDGNADVLLVHARAREDAFMDAGHGVRREDVMYNDFVIVGPARRPGRHQGHEQRRRGLGQIAEAEAPFVSRGDDSGTHTKEKAIWTAAGIEPAGDWYISAGQGMGAVLTMADEQQAYTLSDRATYLARTLEGTELEILVEGDPILFNPYGVIAVNPDKGDAHPGRSGQHSSSTGSISLPTQELIGQFGVDKFGAPLFTPDSALWREAQSAGTEGTATASPKEPRSRSPAMWRPRSAGRKRPCAAWKPSRPNRPTSKGQTETKTGVLINNLLELAGPADGATTVIFVADDGFTAEATLAEVQACQDCIVSFRSNGGFSIVMPGFSSKLQVKGVIEIQVK